MKTADWTTYKRKTLLLIILFFILRCVLAFILELGNDEAYYWTYSKFLKWNYFDHPPIIAYIIRIFSGNLSLQHYEGFIRLGSVAGFALSTWFIYKTTEMIHSARAGWITACLYSTSFYGGIMAGLHAMPDAPQMVFWTFCLWMLAKLLADNQKWTTWILFGIGAGLCIMSKVHGVFLWFGFGLFILLLKRSWLVKPQLYTALLLTLLITSPILVWNIQNEFATYLFHSSRVTIDKFTINYIAIFEELAGQFFFNNPFHVIIIITALLDIWKSRQLHKDPLVLFNFIALPLALLLLFIALFRDTLPHWNGPAYITLLPLAGIYLAGKNKYSLYTRLFRWGLIGFTAFCIGWPIVINFYPGTYGNKSGIELGKGDITLDKYGWRHAGSQFVEFYKIELARGSVSAGTPIVCYKWWGAHVEYYFCRPLNIEMIGLGGMNTLHEYFWTNKEKMQKVNMATAYCIVPSDEYYNARARYSGYYNQIDSITTIKILRSNQPAHNFYIYRLSGWKGKIPFVQ
jgi:4-amino-4-deoxy-L-arabinose transferase-like glycosyltransferase